MSDEHNAEGEDIDIEAALERLWYGVAHLDAVEIEDAEFATTVVVAPADDVQEFGQIIGEALADVEGLELREVRQARPLVDAFGTTVDTLVTMLAALGEDEAAVGDIYLHDADEHEPHLGDNARVVRVDDEGEADIVAAVRDARQRNALVRLRTDGDRQLIGFVVDTGDDWMLVHVVEPSTARLNGHSALRLADVVAVESESEWFIQRALDLVQERPVSPGA